MVPPVSVEFLDEAASFIKTLPQIDKNQFVTSFFTVRMGLPSNKPFNNRYFRKIPGTKGLRRFRVQAGKYNWWLVAFLDKSDPNHTKVICTHAFNKKDAASKQYAITKANLKREEYFKQGGI